MNNWSIVILATAFVSLVVGLMLFWSVRKPAPGSSPRTTNQIAWLLIALFPVLILFSFFPNGSVDLTILGFSATGAVALFVFIWWFGAKRAMEAIEADQLSQPKLAKLQQIGELNDKIRALQSNLEECQKLASVSQQQHVLTETQVFLYPLLAAKGKSIGLIAGDIQGVTVADVWVNSENTTMEMSRWSEGTISGVIRYLGAKKNSWNEIMSGGDIIADELRALMAGKTQVLPTTVLKTSSGELVRTHNVKAIIHVASVQGTPGIGYRPIENIEVCVTKVLELAEGPAGPAPGYKSILFPLLGAGAAKGNLPILAEKLLLRAIHHLGSNKNDSIDTVYFLAYTDLQLETCKSVLRNCGKVNMGE